MRFLSPWQSFVTSRERHDVEGETLIWRAGSASADLNFPPNDMDSPVYIVVDAITNTSPGRSDAACMWTVDVDFPCCFSSCSFLYCTG